MVNHMQVYLKYEHWCFWKEKTGSALLFFSISDLIYGQFNRKFTVNFLKFNSKLMAMYLTFIYNNENKTHYYIIVTGPFIIEIFNISEIISEQIAPSFYEGGGHNQCVINDFSKMVLSTRNCLLSPMSL